jgi:hypothetical protein
VERLQFLQDLAAKLFVELAEATAVRCTAEDEGFH